MRRHPWHFLRHLLLVALLLATGLATAGCSPAPRLRVLTYNIHHGEGTDGQFDLPRIAAVIASTDPDVVSLQEVDRLTTRAFGIDQAAELGRLTGMYVVYGKAMDYAGGEYGEAILSRYPILAYVNEPLPHSEGYEPRTALAATIEPPGMGAVVVIATHLQHNLEEDRLAQAEQINALFAHPVGARLILAGDLNASHGSPPMDALLSEWSDTAIEGPVLTFPSAEPDRAIDHVLVRPAERWRLAGIRVIDEKVASDHRPLMVVLDAIGD